MFAPAGADFATPGILRWTAENGGELELADRSDPWPSDRDAEFTVHGQPYEGDVVTLFRCPVRRWTFRDTTTHVTSWMVALGEHTDGDERWPKANFRPGTLHKWIPENGLSLLPDDDPARFVLEWRPPERRVVALPGAELVLYPGAEWAWRYAPDWSIATTMTFGVTVDEPRTIDELAEHYGQPLRAFCIFAADEADDLLLESYYDPDSSRRVAVLRRDRRPSTREWRPDSGRFLFQAEHVSDIAATLAAWFDVWKRTHPSLGLFAETIEQGTTFSAPRFWTLYTAAENYWKSMRSGRRPWSVRALAERAAVDETLTGATKDALAVIGATRNYHAHLQVAGPAEPQLIGDQTYESTRRLHVFQACVMRDLGMDTAMIEARLDDHYRTWPVP
ncbi:MAG: hypothetical protein M3389_04280 [Actinomycetota bacterium]|nr:hypothetical protein [Actinomycetota bacterium]